MSVKAAETTDILNALPVSSYIVFGVIAHPITPGPINKASILYNQKATSYSQPTPPFNNNNQAAAQNHTRSENLSPPSVQQKQQQKNSRPLKPHQSPLNYDIWTTISSWLATSRTFEKPPSPPLIVDPDPDPDPAPVLRRRLERDYWLQISRELDLRLKEARLGRVEAAVHSNAGSGHADDAITCNLSGPKSPIKLARVAKHSPLGRVCGLADTVSRFMPQGEKREGKFGIDADINRLEEELQMNEREQEQEQQGGARLDETDEETKATAEQLEAAKMNGTDKAGRVREEDEQLVEHVVDEAVKAKAKKLAADAMAAYKKERERRKYVEGRARDIHKNLLECKPFDIDAARREFSEEELRDVKRIVRELGLGTKE